MQNMFGGRKNKENKFIPEPIKKPYRDYSSSDDSDDEGDDFIQQQIRTQKQQLRQQDEGLEMLSQSAKRLGELSMNISEELGEQNM